MALSPCEAISMDLSFDPGYVSEFGHGFNNPNVKVHGHGLNLAMNLTVPSPWPWV